MSGIDGRIIDKSAYTQNTLKTFSFISAYFVDLLYNHLYAQAIRFHRNRQTATLLDGYKASLDAYIQAINKNDKTLYVDIMQGIYQSFVDYGYDGLTYKNCIDKIVREFVPKDYIDAMGTDDKGKIISTIIRNSSNIMVRNIVNNHLSAIIENYENIENTNIWQDEYIDILILEREKFYHEFINVKTSGGGRVGHGADKLVQTMKREILLLSKQKNEITQELHDIKKKNIELQKVILDLYKQKESGDARAQEFEFKIDELKSIIAELESTKNKTTIIPEYNGGDEYNKVANDANNNAVDIYANNNDDATNKDDAIEIYTNNNGATNKDNAIDNYANNDTNMDDINNDTDDKTISANNNILNNLKIEQVQQSNIYAKYPTQIDYSDHSINDYEYDEPEDIYTDDFEFEKLDTKEPEEPEDIEPENIYVNSKNNTIKENAFSLDDDDLFTLE